MDIVKTSKELLDNMFKEYCEKGTVDFTIKNDENDTAEEKHELKRAIEYLEEKGSIKNVRKIYLGSKLTITASTIDQFEVNKA